MLFFFPWPNLVPLISLFNYTEFGSLTFNFSYFAVFTGFLTAVQVALLTIYDMCKAVDRGMVMSDIKLLEKSGGKSGNWKVG
jgi:hypothetical protein